MSDQDVSDFDDKATDVRTKHDPTYAGDTAFVMTIIAGPGCGQARRIDPEEPPVLVGQSPACAMRIPDPTVSRRHISLEIVDARLRISDLGSTNGTFVNDLAMLDGYLRGGETVRIGGTTLRVERLVASKTSPLPELTHFGRVIGSSPEMRRLYPLLERLARSTVPVIIEGETGTGKEALAESLHEQGPRAAGPFVVFDCTAVPANLMESELFGNEKGAFTGATAMRKGVFEQAHGGTLLIDEIGDLDLFLQPKLLRAIERSEIRRLGGGLRKVDVRILAATRRNLDLAVQEGRFRDDLFHRLAVGRVELPPLRRRRGDVAVLARRFWDDLGSAAPPLPADLLRRWEASPWPGNVRELRNAVARALTLGDVGASDEAEHQTFDASPRFAPPPAGGDVIGEVIAKNLTLPMARVRVVQEFERRYIEHVLAMHGGNVALAAKASGIARRYFEVLRSGKRR